MRCRTNKTGCFLRLPAAITRVKSIITFLRCRFIQIAGFLLCLKAAPPNVRVQVTTIIEGDPARIRFDVNALVGVISSE